MNEMRPTRRSDRTEDIATIARGYDRVALVLQGGGALGAYQIGVYQALTEAGVEPNWISGVSIGAINSALIAGNRLENRLKNLEAFWNTVSGGRSGALRRRAIISAICAIRRVRSSRSSWASPDSSSRGRPTPGCNGRARTARPAIMNSSALKTTLESLIDFDLLNDGRKRLSVGAVNVRTGNFIYFDTDRQRIGPEHIMASGALPPALPAVKIEGEYYWDGGIVSNTPLQYLLDQEEHQSSLVFQVDLFSARGALPRHMSDVLTRHKEIMFSSRTRQNTDAFARSYNLKMRLIDALKRIPPEKLTSEERALIIEAENPAMVNIVHLIYQHKNYEGHARDYEFSGTSMREHRESGYEDTLRTLRHPEWLRRSSLSQAVTLHDLHREDPT